MAQTGQAGRLCTAYADIDPHAVLPVLADLVDTDLQVTDAKHYRIAAQRVATMRRLAGGSAEETGRVEALIVRLRDEHRRRPRLQQEFDRAGLA